MGSYQRSMGTIDPSDTEAFADILTRAYKGEAWADIERSLNVESAKKVSSEALAERILSEMVWKLLP